MTYTLRAAMPEDASAAARILIASHKTFLPYAPRPHTDESVRAWVRDHLLPKQDVTLACDDTGTVGVLAIAREADASLITHLYVDPVHVGRGAGSMLLAHVMATAPRPIRLFTFQQNAGARRFYERYGFQPVMYRDASANEEQCPDVLYELA